MKRYLLISLIFILIISACVATSEATAVPTATATRTLRPTSTSTQVPPSTTITPTPTTVQTPVPEAGCGRQIGWQSIAPGKSVYYVLPEKFIAQNWKMPLNYKDMKKGDVMNITFFPSTENSDRGLVQVFFYDKSEDSHTFLAEQLSGEPPHMAIFDVVANYDLVWGDYYYFSVKREPGTPCDDTWNFILDVRLNEK